MRRRRSRKGTSAPNPVLSGLPLPEPGAWLAMAMVAAALALGGGGTSNPLTEAVLQPVLALLCALPLLVPMLARGLGPVPRAGWALAALVLVIPLLQLVPLPPALWHALPGRAPQVAALALAHADGAWMPWSMAPARTLASLVAMVPPVLVLLHVARLDLAGRIWTCVAIAAMGLVSMALGVLQISHAGGFTWSLYPFYNAGKIDGFQANHNAEADVLAIALMALGVACAAWLQGTSRRSGAWLVAGTGLMIGMLALFLTGSRTGIALAPLAVIAFIAMLWPWLRAAMARLRRNGRRAGRRADRLVLAGLAAAVLGLFVAGIAALTRLAAVGRVLDRFARLEDSRADIWADTLHAIGKVWPMGGGIGSFPVLFNAAERLETVRPPAAGRAHNEWLEWTLEAGLPGLVVLAALVGLLVWLLWNALRRDVFGLQVTMRRASTLFACACLLLLGLHACDDFPMRTMSLAVLAAIAAAFLLDRQPAVSAPSAQGEPDDALPSQRA